MNALGYFLWLGSMALSGVIYFWFVSLPLFVASALATLLALRGASVDRRKDIRQLWTLYSYPLIFLAIGTWCRASHYSWPSFLLSILLVAYLILGLALIGNPRA